MSAWIALCNSSQAKELKRWWKRYATHGVLKQIYRPCVRLLSIATVLEPLGKGVHTWHGVRWGREKPSWKGTKTLPQATRKRKQNKMKWESTGKPQRQKENLKTAGQKSCSTTKAQGPRQRSSSQGGELSQHEGTHAWNETRSSKNQRNNRPDFQQVSRIPRRCKKPQFSLGFRFRAQRD